MEVEDPISAKFRTVIESLMARTTSEIVKVFAEVLLETRVEISRSWKEIDELKQKLEDSEEQRAEAVLRGQPIFKKEAEEVCLSNVSPQNAPVDSSTIWPVGRGDESEAQTLQHSIVKNTVVTHAEIHEPPTSPTTPGTSLVNQSVNTVGKTQEVHVSQTVVKRKRGRPPKSSYVTEQQKSSLESNVMSESQLKTLPVVNQQPSTSMGIIILGKNSSNGAAVTRKKYIQKKLTSSGSVTTTHTLRDRQLLNTQRPCLCCPSYQCSLEEKPKINIQAVPKVYSCGKCENKFNERKQFKAHKCFTRHQCNRCGQKFPNLKILAKHRRSVPFSTRPFPYCCYLCGNMFATQCGWVMHKRIHAHSCLAESAEQYTAKPSQSLRLPKELRAKVEVRLERISDAQLEAALFPKSSVLQNEETNLSSLATSLIIPHSAMDPSTATSSASAPTVDTVMNTPESTESMETESQTTTKPVLGSSPGSEISENVKQPVARTCDSVIPATSAQIQPKTKRSFTESSTGISMDCEEGSSGASDESSNGLNSLSRKRKKSDCDHNVYNGVFPVEKILRWRNMKGRNEVRVKWMPCSLCGAKWKNTWEPAESFISYKDNRNEEPEHSNNQD